METVTFRKWLTERGCSFEQHERGKGGHGHPALTVRRGERSSELPTTGSRRALDERDVRRVVAELGLNYDELPGPRGRT